MLLDRTVKELSLILLSIVTVMSIVLIQTREAVGLLAMNTTVSLWTEAYNTTNPTASNVVLDGAPVSFRIDADYAADVEVLTANLTAKSAGAGLSPMFNTTTLNITPPNVSSMLSYQTAFGSAGSNRHIVLNIDSGNTMISETARSTSILVKGVGFTLGGTIPYTQTVLIQGGKATSTVVNTAGVVAMHGHVVSQNTNDTISYDWSGSHTSITGAVVGGTSSAIFSFNPSGLAAGFYPIQLMVTVNDGAGGITNKSVQRLIQVVSSPPVLSAVADTDSDGIVDNVDGYGDLDQDGVRDYMESDTLMSNIHLMHTQNFAYAMETATNLALRLGSAAFVTGNSTPLISTQNFADFGDGLGGAASSDTWTASGGIYDVVIGNLPSAGASVSVAVPLTVAIPANSAVRVYAGGSWGSFSEDANNVLTSAANVLGSCPLALTYQAGLTSGDHCVKLTVQDGGLNDRDGVTNGEIALSFAVAQTPPASGQAPTAPVLVSPADGATGIDPASVVFEWEPASDADGDSLSYQLHICSDANFTACTSVNVASNSNGILLAGLGGFGLLLFFPVGFTRRQLWLKTILSVIVLASFNLVACGGGSGGGGQANTNIAHTESGLASTTTYYWKVTVSDGNGNTTESVIRSFTTQ
ncbi:MAG: hypothetical protein OEZ68_17425 [Gammaproteobacteria bacterium]|nr:hypothetical protein [Gammaproteobacteria bacterium]MDH5802585.1 hypothetical protein [Gammaproteobacteria bacterium]